MNRLLIILTLIALTSCGQKTKPDNSTKNDQPLETLTSIQTTTTDQKKERNPNEETFDCPDFNFNSVEQQADSLLAFMKRATDSSLTDRVLWEQKFFCAFPNSFKGMQALFGFDNETGAAPLYSTDNPTHNYMDKRIFSDVIGFFSELKSIPAKAYYSKYIKINIDGHWEADNISEAFGFHHRLIRDTETACKTLSTFTDEEIRSVFRFIFDGPHPDNEHNQKIFETLMPEITDQNKRLGNLFYETYATMKAEVDDHGH